MTFFLAGFYPEYCISITNVLALLLMLPLCTVHIVHVYHMGCE